MHVCFTIVIQFIFLIRQTNINWESKYQVSNTGDGEINIILVGDIGKIFVSGSIFSFDFGPKGFILKEFEWEFFTRYAKVTHVTHRIKQDNKILILLL